MKGRRWTTDSPNFDVRYKSGRIRVTGCCIFCNLKIHIPMNNVSHTCHHKKKYLRKNKKEMPKPKYY